MRKSGDLFAGLFFLGLGVGVALFSIRLGLGRAVEPQPGFFPFLSGLALIGLALVLLLKDWMHPGEGVRTWGNLRRPAVIFSGLVLYVFLFEPAGYILSTVILSAIVLRVLAPKAGWAAALVSLFLAVGSYLLFDRLLGVLLPNGLLARLF